MGPVQKNQTTSVDHQALVLDPQLHPQAFHLLYYLVAQLN